MLSLYPGVRTDMMTEPERQQAVQYEEWMMQHNHWLAGNIKTLESVIAKHRKTKKALNAKQRQVHRGNDGAGFDHLWPCTKEGWLGCGWLVDNFWETWL